MPPVPLASECVPVLRDTDTHLRSMDSRYDFIASFAKFTTAVSSAQNDWVARRGIYSIYSLITHLAPTVIYAKEKN